jgi:hypothetical protein
MLAKAAQEDSMDDYLESWEDGIKTVEGTNLDDEEMVAVAAYNLLKDRGSESELYNALQDIMEA